MSLKLYASIHLSLDREKSLFVPRQTKQDWCGVRREYVLLNVLSTLDTVDCSEAGVDATVTTITGNVAKAGT